MQYKIKANKKMNNLFYMDDLKLHARNADELERNFKSGKSFSHDICMKFGRDKCTKATFRRGKLISNKNIILDVDTVMKEFC